MNKAQKYRELMNQPVRMQRQRKKGFVLSLSSRAFNGRDVVYVGRPSKWGNPFKVGLNSIGGFYKTLNIDDVLEHYKNFIDKQIRSKEALQIVINGIFFNKPFDITELRGKNLACWCKPGQPCHADILLKLANYNPEYLDIKRVKVDIRKLKPNW